MDGNNLINVLKIEPKRSINSIVQRFENCDRIENKRFLIAFHKLTSEYEVYNKVQQKIIRNLNKSKVKIKKM